jgi:16S rRNA (cytosine1402-N4)-methyltransferase
LAVDELARLFEELGDERHARRIARAIGQERARNPIRTTRQLASLIERCVPRGGSKVHPATRVFQALRMAVNDELGALERGLRAVWRVLKPTARLVCITFHSGEARLVKQFGTELARSYEAPEGVDVPELRRPRCPRLGWVTRRPLAPGEAECRANPRARSAQLRVMEKLADESGSNESSHGEKP